MLIQYSACEETFSCVLSLMRGCLSPESSSKVIRYSSVYLSATVRSFSPFTLNKWLRIAEIKIAVVANLC